MAPATAWLKSIVTGSLAIERTLGTPSSEDAYQPMPWEERALVFAVREPFPTRTSQTTLVYGRVQAGEPLKVRSRMPDNGIIFSDGMEADYLQFTAGMEATIAPSATIGHLVI
ncbi:hypothetical protein ASE11_07030 [Hydrogenophaga sp. Root209]|uniref:hypothetical protein n=1 Tax=Hydrogenophaga sp. Root209 TaxID=1736490 RepID=UPI0006FE0B31|nr:hypothetical protein [Hydrogenophaga sp. Root209]KRB99473.1 hypothetical protein ASE11_07030 [Hydrogenophaga sp. Root209]